jgi:putative DNA primase/helicase
MTWKVEMLDFNDAPLQVDEDAIDLRQARQHIRDRLLAQLPAFLHWVFPQGTVRGRKFHVGNLAGDPGDSLEIELEGAKAGLGYDHATGESGDIFDFLARREGLDTQRDFRKVLAAAERWLGGEWLALTPSPPKKAKAPPLDELGPHTAKWDYWSADGKLLACVYRYDPPSGKEFRPRDVVRGVAGVPPIRPLYNLPGITKSDEVVLVEGEKCAQALIERGICATTLMGGANAPVDKTDLTPLAGKTVLIWPDKDPPGWDYAERVAQAALAAGALSCAILEPPEDKPLKWDAADAIAEGFDWADFLRQGLRLQAPSMPSTPGLPYFTLGHLLDDGSPLPPDLIAPRVMTTGGLLVLGGAPKIGKSDFLLAWLTHMAAGVEFLGMQPSRPLRVFYLQAEVQYHYLRERAQALRLPASRLREARSNFVATPQLRLVLNDEGLARIIPAVTEAFQGQPVDLIAIDPIRNVFDGGDAGGENDNAAMLFFLSQRVDRLREAVNPEAGVILAHHTRKLGKKQFEEDPFQALAGAGSLRGYYTTGMLLFRPDESQNERQLIFELRNGPALPSKSIDKVRGEWREVLPGGRLVMREHGQRLDAERRRKRDAILQILFEEAARGRCYTANQFAEAFEGQAGLGGDRTIRDRVAALSTQGYIKYFRNGQDYGLPPCRTKFGYLCVEDMVLRITGQPDSDTGEVPVTDIPVLPTHYKCPQSGAALPVENPEIWVYHDDCNAPEDA